FDAKAALDRLGGDAGFLTEIAGVFLQDSPRLLADIRRAVAGQDAPTLRRAAHALKGSVGYLGGVKVSEVALQLEPFGAHGDLHAAPDALAELEQEISRFRIELAAYCGQPSNAG